MAEKKPAGTVLVAGAGISGIKGKRLLECQKRFLMTVLSLERHS